LIQGKYALTSGDFAQASVLFEQTKTQAQHVQEPLVAAQALLGLGQKQLAEAELDAATETLLAAGRQFQLLESLVGDGSAVLGLAQVSIAKSAWDEASENSEAAITRFKQAGHTPGHADALLSRGLARRGKDELDEALNDFEEALHLYHQTRQPLGVVDTRSARASIYFRRNEFDRARDEESKAITQVERVMNTLSKPEHWSLFLRQYVDLYALTALTDVRQDHDKQARILVENFARIAGSQGIIEHLQGFESAIPTSGEDLTNEEIQANKDLVRRIGQLYKGQK
jgi:tetratricopeptide (TPR) repeat protein